MEVVASAAQRRGDVGKREHLVALRKGAHPGERTRRSPSA
jgi:hypothetical protein